LVFSLFVTFGFQFSGASELPILTADCSSSSRATLTGPPISIKKISGPTLITASVEVTVCTCAFCFCSKYFILQGVKGIAAQEIPITVMPSTHVACIEIQYKSSSGEIVPIKAGDEIQGPCGESIKGLGL
jgi:hypothetical protein